MAKFRNWWPSLLTGDLVIKAQKIIDIINMPSDNIFKRARMGQKFVLNNYDWNVQAKKLHNFIGKMIH